MLDPWIIEEIRRREEDRRREQDSRLELPLEPPRYQDATVPPPAPEERDRGVVVIDL